MASAVGAKADDGLVGLEGGNRGQAREKRPSLESMV
jgi:hypothetical protein